MPLTLSGTGTVSNPANGVITLPVGVVLPFANTTAPDGWIECDGRAVSRSTYAALFAAIGTSYGAGDGSTTFNIPDLRGEFVRGWDHGKGVDPGRAAASNQLDAFKAHSHFLKSRLQSGTSNSEVPSDSTGTYSEASLSTTETGGTETRPRNVAMMMCIKY